MNAGDNHRKAMHQELSQFADEIDADIYVFYGSVEDDTADKICSVVRETIPKRTNAYLALTTYGGSPDAAFRIARLFQRYYKSFTVAVTGVCKSAGTLIVTAATEVVMSDYGELGPLDVQRIKTDDIVGWSSGLDMMRGAAVVQQWTYQAFEEVFLSIVAQSNGLISTPLAAEIAKDMAVGLYSPVTAQIEPSRVGDQQRSIEIGIAYGTRLDGGNLLPNAVSRLVHEYPSHAFVIDLEEAKTLFKKVRPLGEAEQSIEYTLRKGLKLNTRRPDGRTWIANALTIFKPGDDDDVSADGAQQQQPAGENTAEQIGAGQGNGKGNSQEHAPSDPQASVATDRDGTRKPTDGGSSKSH